MTLESTPLHLQNLLLREALDLGKGDVDLGDVDTLHQMPDRHDIHLDEVAKCPKPDRLGIHLDEVAKCSEPDRLGIHLDEETACPKPELVHIHHHFRQASDLRNLYVAHCQNCQPDLDGIHHQGTLC